LGGSSTIEINIVKYANVFVSIMLIVVVVFVVLAGSSIAASLVVGRR
jgi:hypothetical protein